MGICPYSFSFLFANKQILNQTVDTMYTDHRGVVHRLQHICHAFHHLPTLGERHTLL